MKLLKKAFAFTFIFMLSVSGLTGYQVNASEEQKHLDILFTHDLHSHLNSFQTIVSAVWAWEPTIISQSPSAPARWWPG